MFLKVLRKYIAVSEIMILDALQYKINTFFLLSVILVPPLAYFFLWKSIYTQKEIIGNYKLGEIITYYIITYFFLETKPRAPWDIAHSIKNGGFSKYITKPINHFFFYFFSEYSYLFVWWITAVFGVVILFFALKNYVILPYGLLPFFLSLLFSFFGGVLGFIIEYILNLLAFWVERPFAFLRFFDLTIYFLSGAIIPLDLLPFKNVFLFLPFKYISFFPARIFIGKEVNINILNELFILFFWIILFYSISQIILYLGRKSYSAPGSI
ncbi:MAG: ABC-2 family transporter protein [Candidatus Hydrothermales bacterium]